MENYTDYFRPRLSWWSWCKMLNGNCFHQWLSPEGWIDLNPMDGDVSENCTNIKEYLGGSSHLFMPHLLGDNRKTLPFWGVNFDTEHERQKGGCGGVGWAQLVDTLGLLCDLR